jgi:hypothetical protein
MAFAVSLHAVALGEYVSVSSQRDAEEADIEKERQMQAKGPAARAHELKELTQIYINRCGRDCRRPAARQDRTVGQAACNTTLGGSRVPQGPAQQ